MSEYPGQQAYMRPAGDHTPSALARRVPFDSVRSRVMLGMLAELGGYSDETPPSPTTPRTTTTSSWNDPTPRVPLPHIGPPHPDSPDSRHPDATHPAHAQEQMGHLVTTLALQMFRNTPPHRHNEVVRAITDPTFLGFVVTTAVARAQELYAAEQSQADDINMLQRVLNGLRRL